MKIEVLGSGCQRCHMLAEQTEAVLKEMGLTGEIEHVTDLKRIMQYRVLSTPALVIDGQVKSAGRMPSAEEIRQWLKEANL